MNTEWQPTDPEVVGADEPGSPLGESADMAPTQRVEGSAGAGRVGTRLKMVGALLLGGVGGAAILGPIMANAASPTPTAVTADPSAGTGNDADGDGNQGGAGGAGHVEAVTDSAIVAKAIGITEADLNTALAGGQTVAQVAKAHNIALQVVIDALVADGTSELAAQVTSGSITQAQADAQKAAILQRATAQANGTFSGRGGPGDGGGGFGHSETVTDTSVVAKAIGITEAALKTALAGGQTVAQVATAHNVAAQVVIDALVADGQSELAARVASGSITQAQADAQKAEILQRATGQVNGTFEGPRP